VDLYNHLLFVKSAEELAEAQKLIKTAKDEGRTFDLPIKLVELIGANVTPLVEIRKWYSFLAKNQDASEVLVCRWPCGCEGCNHLEPCQNVQKCGEFEGFYTKPYRSKNSIKTNVLSYKVPKR